MTRIEFEIVLQRARLIAPNIRELCFARADGATVDYIPGQFISLHILDDEQKARKRSYSIVNVPGTSDTFDIAASAVPGGLATRCLFELKPGETLKATGPFGRLVLREEAAARYIFVATGTGITPYRAMLGELSQRLVANTVSEVVVVHGVRSPEELIYCDDFRRCADEHPHFHYHACYSQQCPEALANNEWHGRVHAAIESLALNPEGDIVYLCGNPNMIDDMFTYCSERDFVRKNIRREKYISGA